jgi:2TM domain-containing protein
MSTTLPDDRERYERARRRVRELRAFYVHLTVFVAVNILLHVINFVTAPRRYWAFWPLLGWGIGLLAHAVGTYRWMPFAGKEWEERKIRELLDKERGARGP